MKWQRSATKWLFSLVCCTLAKIRNSKNGRLRNATSSCLLPPRSLSQIFFPLSVFFSEEMNESETWEERESNCKAIWPIILQNIFLHTLQNGFGYLWNHLATGEKGKYLIGIACTISQFLAEKMWWLKNYSHVRDPFDGNIAKVDHKMATTSVPVLNAQNSLKAKIPINKKNPEHSRRQQKRRSRYSNYHSKIMASFSTIAKN